ncbi:MAG: hypothetical protein ACXWYP_02535 [Pseudonocardia sp.]
MQRTVTAHLAADVGDPALLALQIAVAGPQPDELLTVMSDGVPVTCTRSTAATAGVCTSSTPPPGPPPRPVGGRGTGDAQLQPLVEPQPSHR